MAETVPEDKPTYSGSTCNTDHFNTQHQIHFYSDLIISYFSPKREDDQPGDHEDHREEDKDGVTGMCPSCVIKHLPRLTEGERPGFSVLFCFYFILQTTHIFTEVLYMGLRPLQKTVEPLWNLSEWFLVFRHLYHFISLHFHFVLWVYKLLHSMVIILIIYLLMVAQCSHKLHLHVGHIHSSVELL